MASAITVTWAASTNNPTGYYVYRSTDNSSFPLYATISSGSTLTYTDSNVSGGITYYYKVAGFSDSGSQESAASAAVNATSPAAAGGGSPGGGGGGGASFGPPPRAQKVYPDGTKVYLDELGAAAKIKELDAKFAKGVSAAVALAVPAKSVPATAVAQASSMARAVSPVFNKDLVRGARSADVKRLQELLGVEQSGFFGPLTEKTLKAFQVKHGVVKSDASAGAGKLGPATRAKIAEVFAGAAPTAQAVTEAVAKGAAAVPSITRRLTAGSRGDDVKALQEFLASDPTVYPEGEATGFFGAMTRKAVQRFQEKHGIAQSGDQGYGDVGPATRAKLSELKSSGATVPAAPAPTSASPAKAAIEKQISDALKQLEEIQKQLNDTLKKP